MLFFLCVGGSEKIVVRFEQLMTENFQYSLKFQVLTDVSVMHLVD